MTRKTPLHAVHQKAGAQMVPFAGYDMPVIYANSDITREHEAVRQRAGLFDLSHMGRVRFLGKDRDRLALLVQSFDVLKLPVGRTRYALICNEAGGIQDDILVSREEDALLLVVNAGNHAADLETFRKACVGLDAEVRDETERLAMIAIQGPQAEAILGAMGLETAKSLKYYKHAKCNSEFGELVLSRTGYTGEDGFEVLVPAESAIALWEKALAVGAPMGLIPCGLGARDTLRLEAGMPLHGHEIDATINPYEAGIEFAVRSEAGFCGAEALAAVREKGPARRLIGLQVEGPRIPRQGCPVLKDGVEVGVVCSGTLSPTLKRNIATALVTASAAEAKGTFTVQIRRAEATAHWTELPFYRRKKES